MVAVNTTACPKTVGLVEEVNVAVVSDLLTTWLKADDVLVLKLASPLYTAVIEWEVTDKVEEEEVAEPPLRLLVAREVAPSLKVTVPVGVPAPGETALTVAVKVTDWPNTEGFCDEATATALVALLTVCVKVAERFVLKLPSPLYATVIEWEVTDKVELV